MPLIGSPSVSINTKSLSIQASQQTQVAPQEPKADVPAENIMTVAKDPRYARYLKMVQVVCVFLLSFIINKPTPLLWLMSCQMCMQMPKFYSYVHRVFQLWPLKIRWYWTVWTLVCLSKC